MEHSKTSPKSAPFFLAGASEPGLREDLVGWGTDENEAGWKSPPMRANSMSAEGEAPSTVSLQQN
jgi:hypothetical protein